MFPGSRPHAANETEYIVSPDPKNATAEAVAKEPSLGSKLVAEATGTFMLVFTIVGAGLFGSYFKHDAAASAPGIVALTVALALGISVIVGAYAFGPVSGGHFNPAVSVGLAVAGRFKASELPGYIIAQVLGAILAAAALWLIATGKAGANITDLATNGFGEHSPGKYSLTAALVTEVVLTAVFLLVILGSTTKKAAVGFAGMSIGLCLTLIHLISIPVTNTSVNPARSTSIVIPVSTPQPRDSGVAAS